MPCNALRATSIPISGMDARASPPHSWLAPHESRLSGCTRQRLGLRWRSHVVPALMVRKRLAAQIIRRRCWTSASLSRSMMNAPASDFSTFQAKQLKVTWLTTPAGRRAAQSLRLGYLPLQPREAVLLSHWHCTLREEFWARWDLSSVLPRGSLCALQCRDAST